MSNSDTNVEWYTDEEKEEIQNTVITCINILDDKFKEFERRGWNNSKMLYGITQAMLTGLASQSPDPEKFIEVLAEDTLKLYEDMESGSERGVHVTYDPDKRN